MSHFNYMISSCHDARFTHITLVKNHDMYIERLVDYHIQTNTMLYTTKIAINVQWLEY